VLLQQVFWQRTCPKILKVREGEVLFRKTDKHLIQEIIFCICHGNQNLQVLPEEKAIWMVVLKEHLIISVGLREIEWGTLKEQEACLNTGLKKQKAPPTWN
jgi:hypothetical protein